MWDDLTHVLEKETSVNRIIKYIINLSMKYSLQEKNIINKYLNYIVQYNKVPISKEFLSFIEQIVHIKNLNNGENRITIYIVPYFIVRMKEFLGFD